MDDKRPSDDGDKKRKKKKKYSKPRFVKHGVLGRLVVAMSTSAASTTG